MKIKNIIKNQTKLIKIKLIKIKIFKKNFYFPRLKIENIEYQLKKILQIIYKYHITNQKILFLGSLLSFKENMHELLRGTIHVFENLKTTSIINKLDQQNLKLKIQLIVLLDNTEITNIINQSYKYKIPIVLIGNFLHIFNAKVNYKVFGNFLLSTKSVRYNLFFFMLMSIFRKTKQVKRRYFRPLLEVNKKIRNFK